MDTEFALTPIEPEQIKELQQDTVVHLIFDNGQAYTGKYKGILEENIVLSPISGKKGSIGLPFNRLEYFLQEAS